MAVTDGIPLALLAAVCFALAATLQQRGERELAARGQHVSGLSGLPRLATTGSWLLGTATLGVAYLIQAAALGRGNLMIVQALMVTTIAFTLPLGMWLAQQRVSRMQVLGATILVLGLALFLPIGSPSVGIDNAPGGKVAVATLAVVVLAASLWAWAHRAGRSAPARATALGLASGALYGLSATFAKPAFSNPDAGITGILTSPDFWALCLIGIVAFVVQQMAFTTGLLAPAEGAVSVMNPVIAGLIGALVYEEHLRPPTANKLVAILLLASALFGSILITVGSSNNHQQQPE
jgi:drug/metabolite transporter (DMT)-like permease